ncbi:tRNA (adenosine(37)-N6)-dimethylallyltransferase MiaA [Maricaulis sp.]|uniref:tRNA (adenosine(37)-N6)-dimethylallyltransferase MiaA n=1 Tax=Maricaulis sp. TaxID=1486257 RepID=UPI002613207F|nr:tRNA (adenosine(37)-N6)-dimethylallyltransferase MiaA [Maricaulis sp.]MDF1768294.1 tRNA (adenosine(37)-N6)-dimethylallyltransferase MiaA [Maricaulis sp.]
MTPCLLIAGPTAAGKTALSLAAAEILGGDIINADSMQVYDGLPLITAQPDAGERARAPHHLFGTIDPAVRYSVGEWTRDALALITECRARGRVPVLVGGTGLYFNALVRGLAPVPEIGAVTRRRVADMLDAAGLSGLRAEALRLDPVAARRVEAADRQRLMRIVEVALETGRPLSAFQADTVAPLAAGTWRGIVIEPDREALYARIDHRFDSMLNAGALDEVAAFAARRLDPDLPASKALGVPQLMSHLRGETTLDDAVSLAKRDSRRYAKRQGTWFRNQAASWDRINTLDPAAARDALAVLLEGEAT